MIELTCDKCERTITVDDARVGRKVTCPDCGDVNIVSERSGAAEAEGSLQALGLPPATGPERRIKRVHPAMFRAHPLSFLLLLAGMIGGLIASIVFLLGKTGDLAAVILLVVTVASAGGLLVWKVKSLSVTLEITNKRTILQQGLLSKSTTEVGHDSIRNLQVKQSLLNRMLNVGKLGLSSSGQDEIEIVASNIPRPMALRRIINAYRDA